MRRCIVSRPANQQIRYHKFFQYIVMIQTCPGNPNAFAFEPTCDIICDAFLNSCEGIKATHNKTEVGRLVSNRANKCLVLSSKLLAQGTAGLMWSRHAHSVYLQIDAALESVRVNIHTCVDIAHVHSSNKPKTRRTQDPRPAQTQRQPQSSAPSADETPRHQRLYRVCVTCT